MNWLVEKFNLDLSKVSRLGGHSEQRTHRGGAQFPGMTITYALMEKVSPTLDSNGRMVEADWYLGVVGGSDGESAGSGQGGQEGQGDQDAQGWGEGHWRRVREGWKAGEPRTHQTTPGLGWELHEVLTSL